MVIAPSRKHGSIILNRLKVKAGTRVPTQEEVKTYFQKFGIVKFIRMEEAKNTGLVVLSSASEAEHALADSIHNIEGCEFRVHLCDGFKKK